MTIKVCLIGTNSKIESTLESSGIEIHSYGRSTFPSVDFLSDNIALQAKTVLSDFSGRHFIISSGFLQSKPIVSQSSTEISNSFLVNCAGPVIFAEYIFGQVADARIILIGSESGKKGSYDLSYALSKCSLRMYVKNKAVKPFQQLVLISPSTVGDLGMTLRREDISRLEDYKRQHPKGRFLTTSELCDVITSVFGLSCYLTNIEIEVNGGKFALMKY
jgi:hypothetical protein